MVKKNSNKNKTSNKTLQVFFFLIFFSSEKKISVIFFFPTGFRIKQVQGQQEKKMIDMCLKY